MGISVFISGRFVIFPAGEGENAGTWILFSSERKRMSACGRAESDLALAAKSGMVLRGHLRTIQIKYDYMV